MMRSESKEIYGANVFGIIAMLKEIRRWWTIRKLRNHWNKERYFFTKYREIAHLKCLADGFDIDQRYEFIRVLVADHQQRGAI
ncbi:hypothetical protein [Providencia rettgeri]|uniref:hypothetical protein n=1 Tax=Providencia rettgeri TaxID=587 RepID=UPI001FF906D9|nr:hypothetical protein [Providencia rettgeri]